MNIYAILRHNSWRTGEDVEAAAARSTRRRQRRHRRRPLRPGARRDIRGIIHTSLAVVVSCLAIGAPSASAIYSGEDCDYAHDRAHEYRIHASELSRQYYYPQFGWQYEWARQAYMRDLQQAQQIERDARPYC